MEAGWPATYTALNRSGAKAMAQIPHTRYVMEFSTVDNLDATITTLNKPLLSATALRLLSKVPSLPST